VGAALGGERDPGRRADQDRLAAGVDAERPRFQRPVDERVVERADGDDRLTPPVPRGTELSQQPDQIALGDAELDVLAIGLFRPAQQGLAVVGEPVRVRLLGDRAEHAHLVEPAGEVGRRGDVRRHRDNPRGDVGGGAQQVHEQPPERRLRRDGAAVPGRDGRRDVDRGR
jgi:hypothetical protein